MKYYKGMEQPSGLKAFQLEAKAVALRPGVTWKAAVHTVKHSKYWTQRRAERADRKAHRWEQWWKEHKYETKEERKKSMDTEEEFLWTP